MVPVQLQSFSGAHTLSSAGCAAHPSAGDFSELEKRAKFSRSSAQRLWTDED